MRACVILLAVLAFALATTAEVERARADVMLPDEADCVGSVAGFHCRFDDRWGACVADTCAGRRCLRCVPGEVPTLDVACASFVCVGAVLFTLVVAVVLRERRRRAG